MTDRELMQQALFKIADMRREHTDDDCYEIEEALRARLAQGEPEPEPVAYSDIVSDGGLDPRNKFDTAPPQHTWQGLTDEEIRTAAFLGIYEKPLIEFARVIEAKLKEKNA